MRTQKKDKYFNKKQSRWIFVDFCLYNFALQSVSWNSFNNERSSVEWCYIPWNLMICNSKFCKGIHISEGVTCWTCNLVGKTVNVYWIFGGKPLVKCCFEDQEGYRKAILKWFLEKSVVKFSNPWNLVSSVGNCSRKVPWYATWRPTHLQCQIQTDDKVILHRCWYQSKPGCF
jgi:hypothetical protein